MGENTAFVFKENERWGEDSDELPLQDIEFCSAYDSRPTLATYTMRFSLLVTISSG